MINILPQPKLTRPLGPEGGRIRGVLPQFMADPLALFSESQARYGDIVALRFFFRTVYLLNHPDHIQHVLVNNSQNYHKGRGLTAVKPVVGNGLLTSEGAFHLKQRRLIQPAFHRRQIATFAKTMTTFTERHIAGWQSGQALDLHHELMRLTLTIVVQTLFSVDVTRQNQELATTLNALMSEFRFQDAMPGAELLAWLPTVRRRRLEKMLRRLDKTIYGFIEEARQRDHDQTDLLTMLLIAQDDENGTGMSNQQIRDEVMTLFIAGHETTANAITWTFYLLSQHPAAMANLQAELHHVLNGRTPTLEDVPQLTYSRMVLSEAMRLYPPAWVIGRQAIADDEIGGYQIPASSPILISPWVMHRHPDYWFQPESFCPERFATNHPLAQKPDRYVYFPFGGGPRLCIGEHFAWMEGILLIATIAQRFQFKLTEGAVVEPQPLITLRPKNGLSVVVN